MIRRLLFLLLLLIPAPAVPQSLAHRFLEGSWALRLDGAVIMRFDLEREGESWDGAWTKPTSFRSDGGLRFGSIVMPAVERRADSGRAIGEWAEITFNDPRPGQEPDQFRFRLVGPDRAEMLYVGTGIPPFILERVDPGVQLGPFVEGRVYGNGPPTAGPPALPPLAVPPAPVAPVRSLPAPAPTARPQGAGAQQQPVQGPTDNRSPAMVGR